MTKKKAIIVGAGPGGLTAGMIMAYRGLDVEFFERGDIVGGRNASIQKNGYKFDIGPTFLIMKFLLDQVFEEAGTHSAEFLDFIKLDPMYKLIFADRDITITSDPDKMRETIKKEFPGNEKGYDLMMKREKKRFEMMLPCLQKEYSNYRTMLHRDLFKALPYMSIGKSMWQELDKYFDNPDLKISFTFQAKYLGMSPWDCPAAFMIIPYLEHAFGIYHVTGGLSEISIAMQKVAERNGAKVHTSTAVKQLIIENKTVKGVELENGKKVYADSTVINADFAYAMSNLVPAEHQKKYTPAKLAKKKYSCSTFMLYLGVSKQYDLPHHSIVFSKDYETFVRNIFDSKDLPDDLSIYIRNSCVTDSTDAPKGKSAIYILVPVPNQFSEIEWEKHKAEFRDQVIQSLQDRTVMKDLSEHIEYEKVITPNDWEHGFNVYKGATFNLAHNLTQMLSLRPHNKFEEFEDCYLVGGGTHPGSGLPTIYESGRITANMICKEHGVPFLSKNVYVK
jgi:phytoene desaturase